MLINHVLINLEIKHKFYQCQKNYKFKIKQNKNFVMDIKQQIIILENQLIFLKI